MGSKSRQNWRLIAIHRNDNRALKRDKSPIFPDNSGGFADESRFSRRFCNAYLNDISDLACIIAIFAAAFPDSFLLGLADLF